MTEQVTFRKEVLGAHFKNASENVVLESAGMPKLLYSGVAFGWALCIALLVRSSHLSNDRFMGIIVPADSSYLSLTQYPEEKIVALVIIPVSASKSVVEGSTVRIRILGSSFANVPQINTKMVKIIDQDDFSETDVGSGNVMGVALLPYDQYYSEGKLLPLRPGNYVYAYIRTEERNLLRRMLAPLERLIAMNG